MAQTDMFENVIKEKYLIAYKHKQNQITMRKVCMTMQTFLIVIWFCIFGVS